MPAIIWPNNAKLALSLVVNVEEGAEARVDEGDKRPEQVDELGISLKAPIRNYGNESNYAYGIKAGAPRVLRLLKQYGMRATFTAAAQALERAPDLAREIVAQRHEVCSHGYKWVHQFGMKKWEEENFIRQAVDSIEQTCGVRPYGWLSRYLLTASTRDLLIEQGFTYHMDDYSDDLPFWNDPEKRDIVIMPYALDSNDMKMWTDPAMTPANWLEYAVDTFDWLYREGQNGEPKMMSFGVHLRIIGRPGRIGYFEKFLQHAASKQDVWVATRKEIADHFAKTTA